MNPAIARIVRTRLFRVTCVSAVAAATYPAFLLAFVYAHFFASGLPGGRHGPADAYRHALASAIVAYTLHPRGVDWVTQLMERDGRGSPARAMDAHNNRLGARIGASAESITALRQSIAAAVSNGAIAAASPDQITWLAPDAWQDRLY